jgi:hypothetical protein
MRLGKKNEEFTLIQNYCEDHVAPLFVTGDGDDVNTALERKQCRLTSTA